MGDNDILWRAVHDRNISAVEEILKQCTQEILEFRGEPVSIICSYCTSLLVPSCYLKSELKKSFWLSRRTY